MIRRYYSAFLLLFFICERVLSQWTYLPAIPDIYGTGYVTGANSWIYSTKYSGDINVGQAFFSSSTYLGWSIFDISSIPSDAIINSVGVLFHVKNSSSSSNFTLCVSRLNTDPTNKNVSANDIINSFNETTLYQCELIGTEKDEVEVYLYGTEAVNDLQNAVYNNHQYWGVFLHEEGFDDRRIVFNGNTANDYLIPQLAILYTEKCDPPTDLTVLNLGQTSARLDWNDIPDAREYEVAVRKNDSAWTYYTTDNSHYDINGLECGTGYEFKVRTYCGKENYSVYTTEFGFRTEACPCNTPAGLTVQDLGQTSCRLNWTDVYSAVGYEISFREVDSIWSYFTTDTSYYDVSGLNCETNYEFAVRADCGNENYSELTLEYQFTTSTCPCEKPTDIEVMNIDQTSASLDWNDIPRAEGYEVALREEGTSWNYLTVDTSYYYALGLNCGKIYEFQIRSNCGSGNYSDYSNENSFATKICPCNIPAGLIVTDPDQTSARIDWADVLGAIGYEIAIRSSGTSWNYLQVDSSYYNATELNCGKEYEIMVRSYCGRENYSLFTSIYKFSTEVCPCNTPSDLNVSNLNQTSATLDWNDISGAQGYEVAIRDVEAAWSYLTVGSSYYNILGLECGTDYEFMVRSNCGNGNYSEYSKAFGFSAQACPCEMPANLIVTDLHNPYASFDWSDVYGAGEYEVALRKKESNWNIYSSGTSSIDISGLECEENYEIAVRTKCTNGNFSSYTNVIAFASDNCPCYFPNSLSYANTTSNGVLLDWSKNGNNNSYEVRYKPAYGLYWEYITSSSSSYSTSFLDCGTTYNWQVNSICGENNHSVWVRGEDFTTNTCSCNAPANLSFSNITTNSIDLDWDNAGINNYQVRYKPINSTFWTVYSSASNSFTPQDLECSIRYNWQVRSNCGDGSYSKWKAGTDFTAADCSCSNPNGLNAISTGETTAYLNWPAIDGVIGYEIRYQKLTEISWINVDPIITKSNYSLTGLACGTSYKWEMRTYCGNGNFSSWNSGGNFTTLTCPCNLPQKPEFIMKEMFPAIDNSYTYKVQVFPEVDEYYWDISSGISTQDFNVININWNIPGNQVITVKSLNTCGESKSEQLSINVIEATPIPETNSSPTLFIFPNPTSDFLNITPSTLKHRSCIVSIINCAGSEVLKKKIELYDDSITTLDLTHLQRGVYYLMICNKDFLQTVKIVKN